MAYMGFAKVKAQAAAGRKNPARSEAAKRELARRAGCRGK